MGLLLLVMPLQFLVQAAHRPWPGAGGMPDSSLPVGDGPGGARGNTGGGDRARPESP
jgi:hypothetical protein